MQIDHNISSLEPACTYTYTFTCMQLYTDLVVSASMRAVAQSSEGVFAVGWVEV